MRALGYTCGDGVLRRQGRANTNWNCSFRQEVWDPGHTRRCNSDHCKLVQEASVPNSVKRLFEVHEHCWWLLAAVQRSHPGVRNVNELMTKIASRGPALRWLRRNAKRNEQWCQYGQGASRRVPDTSVGLRGSRSCHAESPNQPVYIDVAQERSQVFWT